MGGRSISVSSRPDLPCILGLSEIHSKDYFYKASKQTKAKQEQQQQQTEQERKFENLSSKVVIAIISRVRVWSFPALLEPKLSLES